MNMKPHLEVLLYNDRSGSQLYKMAGNSIVVDVLYHIFKNLLTKVESPDIFFDV